MKPKRDYKSILDYIRCRMQYNKKIGFFDYHPLSYDNKLARARAERICQRITKGKRLTIEQALQLV